MNAMLVAEELELVALAQQGCERSLNRLVENYQKLARRMSGRFFLPGGERQDVVQEAMVGLALAIRSFDPGYGRAFSEHVILCVRNSLIRAIRSATRKKHRLLDQACELKEAGWMHSPERVEEQVQARLDIRELGGELQHKLSDLEKAALMLRLQERSVEEIAAACGVSSKQVENALFRARQKAREVSQGGAARRRSRSAA